MKRRTFLNTSLAFSASWLMPATAHAQILNLNDAINKAGRQRMLSQRLAKVYVQIGMGVEVEQSKKTLDLSLAIFDRQLVELRAFAPIADSRSILLDIEKVWLDYKQLLVGKVANPSDGKAVLRTSDTLLDMAEKLTRQLEKQAGNPAGKLVNLAGRQRMLSQRMAKHYQSLQWGIAASNADTRLEQTRKEFVSAMNTLDAASNTQRLRDELMLAQSQWAFFDTALHQTGEARLRHQHASYVATTSERILESMDRVTLLFQQLG